MGESSIRVLVVDDSESWRLYFSTTVGKQAGLQVIGEVSDGLEAVQRAEELQPDLILLDIGLPTLNGIEAAHRIQKVSPASKILFVSENRDWDIAKEALNAGAGGYLVKSDAARELMPAVNAVLEGRRFVSTSLSGHGLNGPPDPQTGARFRRDNVATLTPTQNVGITRHEAGFYTDDGHFLDDVTRFIESALKAGDAAIVAATESHRENLLLELQAHGLDMGAAIEQGRYISVDAADTVSTFIINGMLDPVRFLNLFRDLIVRAADAAKGEQARVAVFGEGVHLLCAQGNVEAAIQIENLGNKLTQIHHVDILCGYSLGDFASGMDNDVFHRICTEHSAVHTR